MLAMHISLILGRMEPGVAMIIIEALLIFVSSYDTQLGSVAQLLEMKS